MGFKHGTSVRFYWHDTDMTPYVESISLAAERGVGEAKPLASGRVARVPGFMDVRVELAGLYDGAEDASADFVWARLNEDAQRPFSYLPHGDAFGSIAYCGVSNLGSVSQDAGDDVIKMPVGLIASDAVDRCLVLAPLAERDTDSSGSALDNSTGTSNGGIGILHCTALDVGASVLVTIEHSADLLNWSPLINFSLQSARGSQVIEVSGPVDRYVRATWDVTGGGATFFVAFGRR